MIVYQLRCSSGHEFEAWFRNGATFDRQAKSGDVDCPFCGDIRVAKAPMAPRLGKGVGKTAATGSDKGAEDESGAKAMALKVTQAVAEIRRHVEENCDYMGEEFAAEARRIHHGEAEERGIYGEATRQEAVELTAEGIPIFRLPQLPRRND